MRGVRGAVKGVLAVSFCVVLGAGIARAEVFGGEHVRATLNGHLEPHALPRTGSVPVSLQVEGGLTSTDGSEPPRLQRLTIEINRYGELSTAGLPVCPMRSIRATSTERALAACRDALVGSGHFTAHIGVPSAAPFPAVGRMLLFNSVLHGRHVILAHIYGTDPLPTSRVLVIAYHRASSGAFGTTLSIRMPSVTVNWGYATGFQLNLHRRYTYGGRPRSFINASCPAPRGLDVAFFTAAKGTYYLAEGRKVSRVLKGNCAVRR